MRYRLITLLCAAVLLMAASGRAERKYNLDFRADFMGGAGNTAGSSGFTTSRIDRGIMPFYSVYPGLKLDSLGQHSDLSLSYSAIAEQYPSESDLSSVSHLADFRFDSRPSKRMHLQLTESFHTMPDFSVMTVLSGISLTPEGFNYVFEPSLERGTSLNNNAGASLDLDLTARSFLTFSGSSSYRHYDRATVRPGYFLDQTRTEAGLGYSRRATLHRILSLKYTYYQNDFADYPSFRGHRTTLGYDEELSPSLRLSLEAGPSYLEKSLIYPGRLGVYASAHLAKTLRVNWFSLNYTYRSADSTGIGYLSDSHQAGVSFSRRLSKYMSLNLDVSGFRLKQDRPSLLAYWQIQGSAAVSWTIGEHWVASIGGNYQTYKGRTDGYNVEYKRAYVSIGYRLPVLWRGSR